MKHVIPAALLAVLAQTPAFAQSDVPPVAYDQPPVADRTTLASSAAMTMLIARTRAELARNGKTFFWQPLLRDGTNIAAIEYWSAAARPAIHPVEAEYATVLDGTGTLVTGGTLVGAKIVRPGFVDGDRIEGGTARMLHKGDTVLIPAGVAHWFGIPAGKMLILLGIKVPVPAVPGAGVP